MNQNGDTGACNLSSILSLLVDGEIQVLELPWKTVAQTRRARARVGTCVGPEQNDEKNYQEQMKVEF